MILLYQTRICYSYGTPNLAVWFIMHECITTSTYCMWVNINVSVHDIVPATAVPSAHA